MKRYIKKISQVSAFGSMAVLAPLALNGCGEKPKEQPAAAGSSVGEASKA